MTDRGVIVSKPDHLSAFTIDKDKIDFYKQAQIIYEKQIKSEKNRGDLQKVKTKTAATINKEKHEKAQTNQKAHKEDIKIKRAEILQKDSYKTEAAKAVKLAWKKDSDTSKEIRSLKKQDQVENYERGQAMQQLYKQKLIEKMLYKYNKADKFKANIEKLKMKIQKQSVDRFKQEARQQNADYEQKMKEMKDDDDLII